MVVRKILETTLTAGQTSVHFTDSDIPLSLIRVYTSDPDLLPTERILSGTTVTVNFEAQSSNVGVALEIVKAGLDIIDELTSTDATAALSAKQGKVLKDAIDDMENAIDDLENAIEPKADKSTIGTEETGATASKAYTVGEHFIKDGKFCTAIASISSGATLTLNTNYVEGTIADYLKIVESSFTKNPANTWLTVSNGSIIRSGNHVSVQINFSIADMPTVSGSVTLGTVPYAMKGGYKFGRINDGSAPFASRSEGVFISSTNKNLNLCAQLPNGSYFLAVDYITTDAL